MLPNIRPIIKTATRVSLLVCPCSYSLYGATQSATESCHFIHPQTQSLPNPNKDEPHLSIVLLDDRISLQRGDKDKCSIPSFGFPIDLIWLYPYKRNIAIVVEDSALGKEFRQLDLANCTISQSKHTTGEYKVDKEAIWELAEGCVSGCKPIAVFKAMDLCF